eukprot:Skav227928  [mRNA]  locus=scaffold146:294864:298907:- [translate_table: standard]
MAMWVAQLDLQEVVLDMAAAPGGKTTYIGQLMRNSGTLFANDLRKDRCKALVANVHRLGLTNVVVTNLDGKKLSKMLPRLDRVLLDAPCTGSGCFKRQWNHRQGPVCESEAWPEGAKKVDFESHSRLQKELLTAAIDMVDAGDLGFEKKIIDMSLSLLWWWWSWPLPN